MANRRAPSIIKTKAEEPPDEAIPFDAKKPIRHSQFLYAVTSACFAFMYASRSFGLIIIC